MWNKNPWNPPLEDTGCKTGKTQNSRLVKVNRSVDKSSEIVRSSESTRPSCQTDFDLFNVNIRIINSFLCEQRKIHYHNTIIVFW